MTRLLVILLFLYPLCHAAEVRIQGLRTISEKEALSLIGGSLEFVLARDASASRGDDASFLLERMLEKRGYNNPSVRAEVRPPKLIILHVDEGPLSTLGSVTARGVDEELATQVAAQFESAHQGKTKQIGAKPPYLESETAAGVSNAAALLHSMGYWDAKVTLATEKRNPSTGVTDVSLDVVPGTLYKLAKPSITAGTAIDRETEERLAGLTGKVADTKNIMLARTHVERSYRGDGYQNAKVEMTARRENGLTYLNFVVTPGKQYTVRQFTVTGEEHTKHDRIANQFKGIEGNIYDSDHVNDRIKKLFATGAFSGIQLDEAPLTDGSIDLTLRVTEGKRDGYYFYAGAGSWEGAFLGGGYYNRNLFGKLWNLTSALEISGIGLLGNLRVTDPFFLDTDLRFTGLAFLHSRNYDGWSKFEGGFGAELDWKVTDRYSLSFQAMNSFVSVTSDGIPSEELGPTEYGLLTLGVTQVYDRRDDPVLPTKGIYASLKTDIGATAGSGNVGFLRADGKISAYYPVTKKSNLAVGLRAGVIAPSETGADLPIDLRFFTGGSNSVRSFPERELGPQASNGAPLGGEAYWVANLEYIQSVKGPLRLVAFLDAGSLSGSDAIYGDSEIELAAGLGLRLDLPIGPVRLEYGHSLTQDKGEPSGAFHFAIGTSF